MIDHPIDIHKYWVGQKIHMKSWKLQCEMKKNDESHNILKKLKWIFFYIGKISLHLILKLFIWWWFFFSFFWHEYYIFLSPHFSLSLCDKHNVIISKVYYESIFLIIHSFFFNMMINKVYYNMNNQNFNNIINDEYDFKNLNLFVIQKNCNCDRLFT